MTEGKSIDLVKEVTGDEKKNTHVQAEVNGDHAQPEVNVKHAQAEVTLKRISRCWNRWVFCLACFNVSTMNLIKVYTN